MSAGTYEYISESEMLELRRQWKDLVNKIKANQPKMIRVRVNKYTTVEIAEGKNIKKVLHNLKQGRERYYMTDESDFFS
ncbi:hypothetical protein [Dysgonomonas sp. 520]|uniref:hypothetical protein n=1 Tax=Dysgonomonas sp. 520 TaxID=2302931 RepID=UPI0013D5F388|nr:hypothetical protein [Dysgonomonas sp. 520]NDW10073.1 hypothetical protein [Dysgonomonas sp. 520]